MTNREHSIKVVALADLRHRGFTLVELLLAMAVTMILVLIVGGIVTNVLSTWGRSSGLLSANSEANAVLQSLQTDWEAALSRRDGNEWGYLVNEGGSGPLTNFNHATRLLFFSQVLDRQTADASGAPIHGELSAVSYLLL